MLQARIAEMAEYISKSWKNMKTGGIHSTGNIGLRYISYVSNGSFADKDVGCFSVPIRSGTGDNGLFDEQ